MSITRKVEEHPVISLIIVCCAILAIIVPAIHWSYSQRIDNAKAEINRFNIALAESEKQCSEEAVSQRSAETFDAYNLFWGGYVLGISQVWSETSDFAAGKRNYRTAHKALSASNVFADMDLADSVLDDLNSGDIADPGDLARKVEILSQNLTGQLAANR